MSNAVIYQASTQNGAVQIGDTAGSLISLLDTCLITGYGSVVLTSVTVSSGVATCTRAGGHFFANIQNKGAVSLGPVVNISGATPEGLNGNWRITINSASQFTFACPGVENATASGTIVAKIPPLGWTKVFDATHTAVYRNTAGSGTYLRINDNWSAENYRQAEVRGYEAMSSVDVGTGPFPGLGDASRFIPKYASTSDFKWILVGDAKRFYLFNRYVTGRPYWTGFFGDIISYVPGDAYPFVISADDNDWDGADHYASPFYTFFNTAAPYLHWMARGRDQGGAAMSYSAIAQSFANGQPGTSGDMPVWINAPDGRFWWEHPIYVARHASPQHIRGAFPGAWRPGLRITTDYITNNDLMLFENITNGGAAKLLIVPGMISYGSTSPAYPAIDVNGPWE